MASHVAFLRGINLGRRRVKNEQLRAVFVESGLEGVDTFLASGNVVFDFSGEDTGSLERSLESQLEQALGFRVDTYVRPMTTLNSLLELDWVPQALDDGFNLHVLFLSGMLSEVARANLEALSGPDDAFRTVGREVFWLRRGNLSDTPIPPRALEKALDVGSTARNLNTVRRLIRKYGGG